MNIGKHLGVETSSNSGSSSIDNRDGTRAASEDSTCSKSEKKEEFTSQLKASPKTGYGVLKQMWKPSIFLCIFVLTCSAAVPKLLERNPFFVERALTWLEHFFSAVTSGWLIPSNHSQNWASSDHNVFRYSLLWMAPFFSGGGYCSEAISYITAVNASSMGTSKVPKLAISHCGDAENLNFWKGLPSATRQTLISLTAVPMYSAMYSVMPDQFVDITGNSIAMAST